MGWQHHPPRHAAARAALGVQAAHATLGMRPHMPPSSPRHANAKRACPRHRWEPSHATAVAPCPVHAAPPVRPMPMRTRLPPMQRVPMAQRRGSPRGAHPCLPPDVAHQKAHGCPSPPCNERPPRALGPVSARRGALKPSSEHVASKRRANGQRRGSPRGLTHASRPTLPIQRHALSLPSRRGAFEPSSELVASKKSRRIVAMPISVL